MKIAWTDHAILRIKQRFGLKREIPDPSKFVFSICKNAEDGQKFRLAVGDVVFIFVKYQHEAIIVTVHKNGNPSECRKVKKDSGYRRRDGKGINLKETEREMECITSR
jgi:bifunctional DNA-binding transcriptional regulator/antitoxin component of YhaV-PrlF toxin-antitoxin module